MNYRERSRYLQKLRKRYIEFANRKGQEILDNSLDVLYKEILKIDRELKEIEIKHGAWHSNGVVK